ncbi:MAG: hypothetical protein A3K19_23440 [Lentisphaerae bacterium RIFOXYB12_FULL_65_16]|nr:MAG: hypothetical protein A3K18_20650 [Lentisphaerae bacterium RIFOXYA12_64_32]OGV91223.1 MAG: hypothetical protein A3K19_23440 [Lentisphaerae bacterium RIFOXYB12_FULL_65_16]
MSDILFQRASPAVAVRGIHLDLKGMPPTAERLVQLPEIFAELKINALLVEWEDTYPFTTYPELRCPTAYDEDTIRRFLDNAAQHGVEVIPLVQCLGHLENPLLKARFKHLREVATSAGELCPRRPGARDLVLAMFDDVLKTHRGHIRRFHIGGDEPWTFGSCPDCKAFADKHGKAALYRDYLMPLLEHLNAQGIRPLVWDDEMRRWPDEDLKRLAAKADLVVWWYADKLEGKAFGQDLVFPDLVKHFRSAGAHWWAGSAFKVSGEGDLPPVEKRAVNNLLWTREAVNQQADGVLATGWTRGSVTCTQVGGLETAWDSIALAAAIMWDGDMPPDAVAVTRAHLATGRCKDLIGEPFSKCFAASLAFKDWKQKMDTHGGWQWMERSASISFEPERINPFTDRRFFSIDKFRDELLAGVGKARDVMAAHRGLVPEFWLKRYVAARLFHGLNRYNLLVGSVHTDLRIPDSVFAEFR